LHAADAVRNVFKLENDDNDNASTAVATEQQYQQVYRSGPSEDLHNAKAAEGHNSQSDTGASYGSEDPKQQSKIDAEVSDRFPETLSDAIKRMLALLYF
jgi:hypothetical protein